MPRSCVLWLEEAKVHMTVAKEPSPMKEKLI